MKKNLRLTKFLGDLELVVMEIVWQNKNVSVRDVLKFINQGNRPLAYTTVMTVLHRLKKKGWLTSQKSGRAFIYQPAFSRQDAEGKAVGKVVRDLIQDHGEIAIAQFLKEVEGIPPDHLSKLADLANSKEEQEGE